MTVPPTDVCVMTQKSRFQTQLPLTDIQSVAAHGSYTYCMMPCEGLLTCLALRFVPLCMLDLEVSRNTVSNISISG